MIADKDLISIQHARILAENACEAQKKLATFSQEELDRIVESIAEALEPQLHALAVLSHEETDFGIWQDKLVKNRFICQNVRTALRGMRCVGVIDTDHQNQITSIGIPMGVIVALCPVTSPVSTTIYKTLLALKSGNAIIFSPHPRAIKSMSAVLDLMIQTATQKGLPEGCLSYLNVITKSGTLELMNHSATSLIMISGVPGMFHEARCVGKPIIYGGTGNGPAFIERTANIEQAVQDIVASKTFDNGIAPSAELALVVDGCVAQRVKHILQQNGAYFMTEKESTALAELFFYTDGRRRKDMVGKSAAILAQRAGFSIPVGTRLLVAERPHVSGLDPYARELLSPVIAFYIEDDWMHACEKCIELLISERNAHTLSIHSKDEDVIHQFAIKKPVGRLLVNTPASFGGIGATTNLFPSMTLGSGTAGFGITTDNVSPSNLTYIRKVGYGVRQLNNISATTTTGLEKHSTDSDTQTLQPLLQFLEEATKILNRS